LPGVLAVLGDHVAVAAAVDVEEVCTPFKSSIPSLPHATPTNTDLELSDAMRCAVRACVRCITGPGTQRVV
jgi:hypothetical protein